jgi:hypothetical protein
MDDATRARLSDILVEALLAERRIVLLEVLAKIDAQIAEAEKDGARGGDLRDVWLCRGDVQVMLDEATADQAQPRP